MFLQFLSLSLSLSLSENFRSPQEDAVYPAGLYVNRYVCTRAPFPAIGILEKPRHVVPMRSIDLNCARVTYSEGNIMPRRKQL